ncbi:MAG TPA: PD-(D/E)XK nuclease family protein [Patescibacteria group bacterium]|nr:PD-(D/E)XK nuclease family protein [Patescibacteria group bacterium]
MSQYYNPKRGPAYNYGGSKWKLSRSKIDLYLDCPRCFYLDNKLGVKRPPGFPFALNSAVDALLKKEFDILREKGETHELIDRYGVDAKPVRHEQLDVWRENFQGVQYYHQPTGFQVSGAIDDLWINSRDEYIVVDYKSTSKNEEITELNKEWQEGYKRQMEVYQWLLRQNGYPVSNTGYFVYCNGLTNVEKFDAKLEFRITLVGHEGDDSWIEPKLNEIKQVLDSEKVPPADPDCDFCAYREAVDDIIKK